MRYKEFTINIPINIKFNGDGTPDVDMDQEDDDNAEEKSVFVPPLQQHLELAKSGQGKSSKVINQLIADEPEEEEPEPQPPTQRSNFRNNIR